MAVIPSHLLRVNAGLMCVNECFCVCMCAGEKSVLVMTKEWLHCVSVAGMVASAVKN